MERNNSVVIREGVADDAAVLTEIAFAAKRHWEYPEAWIALWADGLTISAAFIAQSTVFVAEVSDSVVGWCAVVETRGEYDLEHCWVLPDALGQGVGRLLAKYAVRHVEQIDGEYLNVTSDPNAEGFYLCLGFERVGVVESTPAGRELPVLQRRV